MKFNHFVVERPVVTKKVDTGLVVSVIILLGLGLVTLQFTSADYGLRQWNDSGYFLKQQILPAVLGLILLPLIIYIDLDIVRRFMGIILILTFVFNLLTFSKVLGLEINGGRRWINLFGFSFQPSEIAKLTIVFFLANLFDKKKDRINDAKTSIVPAVIVLGGLVLTVVKQNDYATSMIILGLGLLIFFLAGVSGKWFGALLIFAIPFALFFIFLKEYRVERLIAFLRPEFDVKGINYQIDNSKIAISAGGFFGQGMGAGLEKIKVIPEVHADCVFAGWVEAMGFLGVIGYFALLGYFAYRGYKIAIRTNDLFRQLLAFGCTTSIVLQSLMNCGVVCGALPATGIPLPFFSHGGSSIFMTLVTCGLIINISRYEKVSEFNYER